MNEPAAKIYYGEAHGIFILKITGSLRFNQCFTLEKFLKENLTTQTPDSLLVDLSTAELLDSTALGLLAQIALAFQKLKHKKPDLFCKENDLKKVLLSMSLEQLFHFTEKAPLQMSLPILTMQSDTQQSQTERVLSAHETLMGLSEKNKKEFKSVVDMLKQNSIQRK